MNNTEKKVFYSALGPIIGTAGIIVLAQIDRILNPLMYDNSGPDEVSQMTFYFLFLPMFCLIGICLQVFILNPVYSYWLKKNEFNLLKLCFLNILLIMISAWIYSVFFQFESEDLWVLFPFFLFVFTIYFSLSQSTYYVFFIKRLK